MASDQTENVEFSSVVKSSPDKLYDFFKSHLSDIVKVFPAAFTSSQLVQGEEGKVGCDQQWTYIIGGVELRAKTKLTEVDDVGRNVTYTVVEGDILVPYKSFAVRFGFGEQGVAKCSLKFEKASVLSPPPDAYVALGITAFTLVDEYLLTI